MTSGPCTLAALDEAARQDLEPVDAVRRAQGLRPGPPLALQAVPSRMGTILHLSRRAARVWNDPDLVIEAVLRAGRLDARDQYHLAHHPKSQVRAMLARQPGVSADARVVLRGDDDMGVRGAWIANPALDAAEAEACAACWSLDAWRAERLADLVAGAGFYGYRPHRALAPTLIRLAGLYVGASLTAPSAARLGAYTGSLTLRAEYSAL